MGGGPACAGIIRRTAIKTRVQTGVALYTIDYQQVKMTLRTNSGNEKRGALISQRVAQLRQEMSRPRTRSTRPLSGCPLPFRLKTDIATNWSLHAGLRCAASSSTADENL